MDDQELLYYSSLHSTSSFDYSISTQQQQPAAQGDMGSWGSCSFHDNRDSNNNITPTAVVYGLEQMGSAGKSSSSGSGPDAAYSSSSPLMLLAEIQNHRRIDTTATTSQQHQQEHQDIRARIASHPLYPNLLSAYIDCHQVGAPPEMDRVLDEIRREGDVNTQNSVVSSCCWGADPELDEFMESYCDILVKHKSDLSKPFDEASSFLSSMEAQLSSLCSGLSRNNDHDAAAAAAGSSEEEISGCETTDQVPVPECIRMPPVDREIKDKLIRKYGGYICTLKHEFSKSKKKCKLPKDARQILFDWWNLHNKWPYPTEGDKVALAETTGLDQRQINNWFINQRKRHWKPPESVQLHLMDNLYGRISHE